MAPCICCKRSKREPEGDAAKLAGSQAAEPPAADAAQPGSDKPKRAPVDPEGDIEAPPPPPQRQSKAPVGPPAPTPAAGQSRARAQTEDVQVLLDPPGAREEEEEEEVEAEEEYEQDKASEPDAQTDDCDGGPAERAPTEVVVPQPEGPPAIVVTQVEVDFGDEEPQPDLARTLTLTQADLVDDRPRPGDLVTVVDDYLKIQKDAKDGPMKPGDVGEVVKDDGSVTPYQVRFKGKTYWYCEAALRQLDSKHKSGDSGQLTVPGRQRPDADMRSDQRSEQRSTLRSELRSEMRSEIGSEGATGEMNVAPPADLRLGMRVQICNMTESQHLNGQKGLLESWDRSRRRWLVRLDGGDLKALKAERIQPAAPEVPGGYPDLQEGVMVKVRGLTASMHLNGQLGVLEAYDFEKGRWLVRLKNNESELKALKHHNLKKIAETERKQTGDFVEGGEECTPSVSQAHDTDIEDLAEEGQTDVEEQVEASPPAAQKPESESGHLIAKPQDEIQAPSKRPRATIPHGAGDKGVQRGSAPEVAGQEGSQTEDSKEGEGPGGAADVANDNEEDDHQGRANEKLPPPPIKTFGEPNEGVAEEKLRAVDGGAPTESPLAAGLQAEGCAPRGAVE